MSTKFTVLLADDDTTLTGATLASGDVLCATDVSDTTEAASGTSKAITAGQLAIGLASLGSLATDAELAAHEADTTSVHGIADTSALYRAGGTDVAVADGGTGVSTAAANRIFAGPATGADAAPSFRALVSADIPNNAADTSGNAATATLAATASAGDSATGFFSSGTIEAARLGSGGAGAGGKVLADNQTFVTLPTGDVVGPSSATTLSVAIFDGTTGKLLRTITGLVVDANGRLTVGASSTGGVNFGSAGARILDSNNDGRLDFVAGGSSRMDIVDVGGAWRLRFFGTAGISAGGPVFASVLNFNDDAGIERSAAGETRSTNSAGTLANHRVKNLAITAGSNVASATTISPTNAMFHLTGTTPVQTINVPYTGFTGCIHLIPDGAGTLVTGGNIAVGVTLVVGRLLTLAWDGTSWYPSYV